MNAKLMTMTQENYLTRNGYTTGLFASIRYNFVILTEGNQATIVITPKRVIVLDTEGSTDE